MKTIVLTAFMIAAIGPAMAAPMSKSDCSRVAIQADDEATYNDINLGRLIEDGSPDVAEAARRLAALRIDGAKSGSVLNATQDLRYQLQVCARAR